MSDLQELAQSWLDRVESDPCQVVYEAMYDMIYKTVVHAYLSESACEPKRRLLVVGAGHGAEIRLFRDLPWDFVAVEKFPAIAMQLETVCSTVLPDASDALVVAKDFLDYADDWNPRLMPRFDVATMMLTTQYMDPEYLQETLNRLSTMTIRLILDVTNPRSLYGKWTSARGWRDENVYYYTPYQIEQMLDEAFFSVTRTQGFGVVSPLSLFSKYRGTIVTPWMSKALRFLDGIFTQQSHIYYLDCYSRWRPSE